MKRKFKEGNIVVWSGQCPCIGKIKQVLPLYWSEKLGKYLDCSNLYYIDRTHSALHEMNLRLADEIEILVLGKKGKVTIPMSKEQIADYISMMRFIKFPIGRNIIVQMKRLGIQVPL